MQRINRLKHFRTFFKLSRKEQQLALKVFLLSGIVRLAVLVVPFKRLKVHLGQLNQESIEEVTIKDYKTAYRIKRIVAATCKYTPWQSKCLVQAIVAQRLLKEAHLASTLYLGVAKDEKQLKAHAWLRCGRMFITGAGGMEKFTKVSCFSNENDIKQ